MAGSGVLIVIYERHWSVQIAVWSVAEMDELLNFQAFQAQISSLPERRKRLGKSEDFLRDSRMLLYPVCPSLYFAYLIGTEF